MEGGKKIKREERSRGGKNNRGGGDFVKKKP